MKTIPQAQASHFCRLLLNDGTTVSPLGYHAQRLLTPNDSMTVEQQFVSYIFYENNWQTLQLFPHCQEDGSTVWYAPADVLQSSDTTLLTSEHQKYIREVFPRLQQEIEACNWPVVDAYIDRMMAYQCSFGKQSAPSSTMAVGVVSVFLLLAVFFSLFIWRKPRNASRG